MSETILSPFQRIAVFPIGNASYSTSEDAWWQIRDRITQDQRFFVSTRRFMINRGVFQPKLDLKPSEVIILAKILEAEVLIVSYIEDRNYIMKVFLGVDGSLLWENKKAFHSTIPIQEQIINYASLMVENFLSELPFTGWLLQEDQKGELLFEKNGEWYAWSKMSEAIKGEKIQLVHLVGSRDGPLFSTLTKKIIAEGEVSNFDVGKTLLTLDKNTKRESIDQNLFVILSSSNKNVRNNTDKELMSNLTNEYLVRSMQSGDTKVKPHNSLMMNLSFIFGLGTYILIAF